MLLGKRVYNCFMLTLTYGTDASHMAVWFVTVKE
jgi:hypothetical protein